MNNKPCPTLGPTCKGCPDCGHRVSCTSDDITNEAARQELEMCGWLDDANSRANDNRLESDLNDCIGQHNRSGNNQQ